MQVFSWFKFNKTEETDIKTLWFPDPYSKMKQSDQLSML